MLCDVGLWTHSQNSGVVDTDVYWRVPANVRATSALGCCESATAVRISEIPTTSPADPLRLLVVVGTALLRSLMCALTIPEAPTSNPLPFLPDKHTTHRPWTQRGLQRHFDARADARSMLWRAHSRKQPDPTKKVPYRPQP